MPPRGRIRRPPTGAGRVVCAACHRCSALCRAARRRHRHRRRGRRPSTGGCRSRPSGLNRASSRRAPRPGRRRRHPRAARHGDRSRARRRLARRPRARRRLARRPRARRRRARRPRARRRLPGAGLTAARRAVAPADPTGAAARGLPRLRLGARCASPGHPAAACALARAERQSAGAEERSVASARRAAVAERAVPLCTTIVSRRRWRKSGAPRRRRGKVTSA